MEHESLSGSNGIKLQASYLRWKIFLCSIFKVLTKINQAVGSAVSCGGQLNRKPLLESGKHIYILNPSTHSKEIIMIAPNLFVDRPYFDNFGVIL